MNYNPHLDQPVGHAGAPLERATGAVIAMHGRERDPEDILAVARRIGLGELAWLAPTAHEYSWYPNSFAAPLQDNEPGLSWTLERMHTLVDEVTRHGIPARRIVLLGFSQGGCAVAEYAVRHAQRYGGVIVLTGSVLGPPDRPPDFAGDFAGTPALVGGSREDEWIDVTRMQQTRDLLRAMGAQVEDCFYDGREHVVSDAEVDAARRIMRGLEGA